ncbi:phosphatases II [Karstenula rhodostoma CBS 690.94]|uniref:protein-tyrosine-phosphatase n=1 Tax=Karstenula rhodostoma CBS 690.94 TaxID=1392251 RepID=A0A9P4PSM4_9PLEO|nr:phosphatases II [Karstenula rhodostoma CBS 690.94]
MSTLRAAPISATPIPNLYISDVTVPNDPNLLQQHKITHVLSLTNDRDRPSPGSHIHHLHIPIEDNPYEDLVCLLEGTYRWIASALTRTPGPSETEKHEANVLVHCVQGQSRSAAVVTAYVMRALDLPYEAALAKVRAARPGVLLNSGFAEQLRLWELWRYSVYDDVEGDRVKGVYVEWEGNRGILMSGVERGRRDTLRERMRVVAVVGRE